MPDERYDRLVAHHKPKKEVPAKIQVFDTPGLSRNQQEANGQKLGIIREAQALVQIVGVFAGADAVAEAQAFEDDLILADFQVVNNRVERLKKDITKPRPDREELQKELEALTPVVDCWKRAGPCGSWNSRKPGKSHPLVFAADHQTATSGLEHGRFRCG